MMKENVRNKIREGIKIERHNGIEHNWRMARPSEQVCEGNEERKREIKKWTKKERIRETNKDEKEIKIKNEGKWEIKKTRFNKI